MERHKYFDKRIIFFESTTRVEVIQDRFEDPEIKSSDHVILDLGEEAFRVIFVKLFIDWLNELTLEEPDQQLGELDLDSLLAGVANGITENEAQVIAPRQLEELALAEEQRVLVIIDRERVPQGRIWIPPKGDIFGPYEESMVGSSRMDGEPPDRVERYANAVLMDKEGENTLSTQNPIDQARVIRLRLDIGELSPESAVRDPVLIPLPDEAIWLDVMLSSNHFEVGNSLRGLNNSGSKDTTSARLFVPKDGSASETEDGAPYLYFFMRAPAGAQVARARIGYYYRNSLLQSHLLIAQIGAEEGGYTIEVDYTLSNTLSGLGAIPKRPTLSILTNTNGDGTYQFVLRAGDRNGTVLDAISYVIDEENVGERVSKMREQMAKNAPRKRRGSKKKLIADLKLLAPQGWELWNASLQNIHRVYDVLDKHRDAVVQVSRPEGKRYAFPWGLMYDIPLAKDRKKWHECKLIEKWDEKAPLVELETRICPEVPNGIHDDNTLCPFGFWGFRYPIEQLASTDDEVFWIYESEPQVFDMMIGETQVKVNEEALQAHVEELKKTIKGSFPGADFSVGKDKDKIRELLRKDLALVYFYCHGQRSRPGSPDTYLGVGKGEGISAEEFRGWLLTWKRRYDEVVWDNVRPLIFINACHSLEINPDTLTGYLDAFVGEAHAAGVIGTEVNVAQTLAMEMASIFFSRFLASGWTLDRAMHYARTVFLAEGNLFGLAYTSYSRANLQFMAQ